MTQKATKLALKTGWYIEPKSHLFKKLCIFTYTHTHAHNVYNTVTALYIKKYIWFKNFPYKLILESKDPSNKNYLYFLFIPFLLVQ